MSRRPLRSLRDRAYYAAHAERKREYARLYREGHREALTSPQALANRRAQQRVYYLAHRQEKAAYHMAHREERLERSRTRHINNRQKRLADAAAWRRDHPELVLQYARERRARKIGAGGSHTLSQWLEKLELFGHCCAYCGRGDVVLVREHKLPLVRRGSDSIDNIVPACTACNLRKGTKTAREFLGLAA